jgi:single-strand DNA-binding protein
MNSCVLMSKIVRRPELRYTQDNQTPYAQMLVEFEASRPEDPPATLRVVAWGNLASEVAESYNEGDRVILEGRISMQTVDRPEGFKEKRGELVISRLYRLDGTMSAGETAAPAPEKVATLDTYPAKPTEIAKTPAAVTHRREEDEFEYDASYELSNPSLQPVSAPMEENLDDIPF